MRMPIPTTPMAAERNAEQARSWRAIRDAAAVAIFAQAVEPLAIQPDRLEPFARDADAKARALADALYPRRRS